jgi:hypothetical protein
VERDQPPPVAGADGARDDLDRAASRTPSRPISDLGEGEVPGIGPRAGTADAEQRAPSVEQKSMYWGLRG